MEVNNPQEGIITFPSKHKKKFNLRRLRLSLKYRPEILKLVLKMRQCIMKKNKLLKSLEQQLKEVQDTMEDKFSTNANETMQIDMDHSQVLKTKKSSTQTSSKPKKADTIENKPQKSKEINETSDSKVDNSGWELEPEEEVKSIADQLKDAAQSALQQSGMVYAESAGMYYDDKTGYYYNSELDLYYHTNTNCYYYYNDDKKEFAFHSYPDRSAVAVNPSLKAHEKRKARKQRKAQKKEDDVDTLAKNLSQVSLRGRDALGKYYTTKFLPNTKLSHVFHTGTDRAMLSEERRRKLKRKRKLLTKIEKKLEHLLKQTVKKPKKKVKLSLK